MKPGKPWLQLLLVLALVLVTTTGKVRMGTWAALHRGSPVDANACVCAWAACMSRAASGYALSA